MSGTITSSCLAKCYVSSVYLIMTLITYEHAPLSLFASRVIEVQLSECHAFWFLQRSFVAIVFPNDSLLMTSSSSGHCLKTSQIFPFVHVLDSFEVRTVQHL